MENVIICADGRELSKHVKPETVHLTITSPPYRNAIDYSAHVGNDNSKNQRYYRAAKTWSTKKYLETMREIFDQVYDATVDGGYCCIVIGYELEKGEIVPLPSLLLTTLLNADRKSRRWKLREEIVWNKVTAGRNGAGNRFGVFVQYPYPKYYHANIMHEYIYILSKGEVNPRIPKEGALRRLSELPLNDIMKREIANSTWNIAPVPPRTIAHPCPFPEQIPWRLILLYTFLNDLVLDPFNGSGQTTKVAKILGRRYIGVDIQQEYVDLAKERLVKEKLGLSRNFIVQKYIPTRWDSEDLARFGFIER